MIVQDAAVRATADDRVIRDVGAVPVELVQQLRHHLVLGHAGSRHAHGANVRAHGDPGRLAHHGGLRPALVEAHVVQRVVERDELLRAVDAVLALALEPVDPAEHALVEVGELAHRVVDAIAALDQPGQDVVDVADRERIVGAEIAHGALGTGAAPVPGLARRVAVAHEQDVLGLLAAGDQHRHRFGLVESGQVVEVAVRTIVIVDVAVALALGRGGQDRDRSLAHGLHQLAPAASVLVFAQGRVHSVGLCLEGLVESGRHQWRAVEVVCVARRSVSSS